MNIMTQQTRSLILILTACLLALRADRAAALQVNADSENVSASADQGVQTNKTNTIHKVESVRIERREPGAPESVPDQRTWLGVATEEATEALAAQLGLDPGVGLTVIYVVPESPAARANLQRHDVLVALEGHALVHPEQLRRLIQVRKPGDNVTIVRYRSGEKESTTVTLSETTTRLGGLGDEPRWLEAADKFRELKVHLLDRPGENLREQLKHLQHSLGELRIDHEEIQREARRGLEAARKSAQEALRQATNNLKKFGPTAKTLEDLARGLATVREDATVTVNTRANSVQTIVKTDQTGNYVIVANPRKHLTVHDPLGKLLFEGEIETPEQQAAVPKELWDRIEPLLDKLTADGQKVGEAGAPTDF